MWVFDGEEWIEEGASSAVRKETPDPREYEEFRPELQVVEIPLRREPVPLVPNLMRINRR